MNSISTEHRKPIRIFVDAHVFDGEFQGTRTFIHGIYSALAKKTDVLLFLGARNLDQLQNYFPVTENVRFIQLKSTSSIARLAFEIPSIIKKYEIDYAHFQYITPILKSCKFIVTTHDVLFNDYPEEFSWFYRFTKNLLYKFSAKRADILTTVSEYSKKSIQLHLETKEKRIIVTPNAVALRFFNDYNKIEEKQYIYQKFGIDKYILYISRIEPRKNHYLLLKSYLDLKLYQKGYHLVLLGSISIPDTKFQQLFNETDSNTKKFIFHSELINDTDILSFYRAADLFVYPSKAEGFGIPPLEAGAACVPVLCSHSTAMSDFHFFEDNLFDPKDDKVLKEKLISIITHPPDPSALKDISEKIKERYNWTTSAEKLYELL